MTVKGLSNVFTKGEKQVVCTTKRSMEDRRLFDALWPIFAFGRYFGMFPCRREKNDNLNDKWKLDPIGWKAYWTLFTLTKVTTSSLAVGWSNIFNYIKINDDKCEQIDGQLLLYEKQLIDYASESTSLIIQLTWGVIINFGTFKAKGSIIELYESRIMSQLPINGKSRIYKQLYGTMFLSTAAILFALFNNSLERIGCLRENWYLFIMDFVITTCICFFCTYPNNVFLSLFFEVTVALREKLQLIQQKLLTSRGRNQIACLQDITELIGCIKTSTQIFSFNLFVSLPIIFIKADYLPESESIQDSSKL